jgi:galactose-1-phosphate uridylyltransferase
MTQYRINKTTYASGEEDFSVEKCHDAGTRFVWMHVETFPNLLLAKTKKTYLEGRELVAVETVA